MKQRLYNILNIKASESNQVFDLLSVQFFMGLANAFINIIAFTLFIYNYSIQVLPMVFLSIAIVLVVLNFFYEKLEHKLSPLHLLKIAIALSIFILLALWSGLTFGNKHDFIFMLLVSNTIIYMVTGYAYWGLVSLLFNVRESRRVFSIVGSGDIPAKLIGYLAGPLLIPIIGLGNLLWIAILAFSTSLYLFNKVIRKKNWDAIRKKSESQKHKEGHQDHKQDWLSFFYNNKLIFSIALLSVLSYNVFILIDYTFISQVKLRFENIADLAIYIAIFFAFGRLIAIVFKLIFTSRVIERLGIIACLFITPIALLLFCLLFFIFDQQSNYNVYIFGVMAMLTEVLRSTMQEPVFFILFQPLKEKIRLKGHIIAKGHTLPPSLIVVSISLLFIFKWGVTLTILLTIKIILANLLIWAGVIFLIQKAYLKTLHNSIEKGTFNSDEKYIYDKTTIDILLNKVNNGKISEVIYALNLLKKAGYNGLSNLLLQQLSSSEKEIKIYALEQLEFTEKTSAEILQNLLQKETDEEVKQKIISILCSKDDAYLKNVASKIQSLDFETRKTVIINLLNQFEFIYLFTAGNEINKLINSESSEDRLFAISIISELKHIQFTDAIKTLLTDKDTSVKRAAVMAACKLKIAGLLSTILNLSDNILDKHLVIKALQQYGDKLFADLLLLPKSIQLQYTPDFIRIASKVKGDNCKRFLLSTLEELNHRTDRIVHALWVQNYQPVEPTAIESLHNLLTRYLKMGISKIVDHHNIPFIDKDKEILNKSIFSEINADLIIALKICSLLFHKKQINRILELIEIENHVQIYNAIEMIELELPKKISKDLIVLFDFILDPAGNKIKPQNNEHSIFFNKIYYSDSFFYNPWTKAILIYCSWKNNKEEDIQKIIQPHEKKEHYIIKETREFVINNFN